MSYTQDLESYINIRNHELCCDEIMTVLDTRNFPYIVSFKLENGNYDMWEESGKHYWFKHRAW